MSTRVRIGMLRLTDSAPVVVARALGLFDSLDIHPTLSIEPSWANVADKLTYGLLDAAVMLPPLALGWSARGGAPAGVARRPAGTAAHRRGAPVLDP